MERKDLLRLFGAHMTRAGGGPVHRQKWNIKQRCGRDEHSVCFCRNETFKEAAGCLVWVG